MRICQQSFRHHAGRAVATFESKNETPRQIPQVRQHFAIRHSRMARSRGRSSGGGERSVEQGPTKPLAARNRAEASGSERRQEGHKEVPHAHKQAATAPVLPSRRSPPSPPPLPAAAEALLLPGLDEDSPPGGGPCHLTDDDRTQTSTFGNPFASADSLR